MSSATGADVMLLSMASTPPGGQASIAVAAAPASASWKGESGRRPDNDWRRRPCLASAAATRAVPTEISLSRVARASAIDQPRRIAWRRSWLSAGHIFLMS